MKNCSYNSLKPKPLKWNNIPILVTISNSKKNNVRRTKISSIGNEFSCVRMSVIVYLSPSSPYTTRSLYFSSVRVNIFFNISIVYRAQLMSVCVNVAIHHLRLVITKGFMLLTCSNIFPICLKHAEVFLFEIRHFYCQ